MPRVPLYEADRASPAQVTGSRFQAAPDPGSIGPAVGRLGEALGEFALDADKQQQLAEDTRTRRAAIDVSVKTQEITDAYKALSGLDAVEQRADAERKISALTNDLRVGFKSQREKLLFDDRTKLLIAKAQSEITTHSSGQAKVAADNTQKSQMILFAEQAKTAFNDPEKLEALIDSGLTVLESQQDLHGFSDEEYYLKAKDYESNVLTGVVETLAAKGDYGGAIAFFNANEDRLTGTDLTKVASALKEPMQLREYSGALQSIMAGIDPTDDTEVVETVDFVQPLDGKVTSKFGVNRGDHSHNGIDIAAALGSNIRPTAPGKVIQVGSDPKSGRFVIVDHGNGLTSSYSHMGKQLVGKGDDVTAKTVLGTVGMTGNTSGPHVHWVVRRDGKEIDPLSIVGSSQAVSIAKGGGYDLRTILDKIDSVGREKGWQIEKVEAVKKMARDKVTLDDQLMRRDEEAADKEASRIVAQLGENFKDINQLPEGIRNNLHPDALRQWSAVAERNSAPPTVAAHGDVQRILNLASMSQDVLPDGTTVEQWFKNESLEKYRGLMTPAEFDALSLKQAGLKRPEKFAVRALITSTITWGQKHHKLELSDDDHIAIFDVMNNLLRDQHSKTGKAPTEEDAVAAFRLAIKQQKTIKRGVIWDSEGSKPIYGLTAENIPAKERSAIEKAFKAQYGRVPTADELTKLFRMKRVGEVARRAD